MIVTKEIMSDERLSKDGIELVAIDEKQLKQRERDERQKQAKEEQERMRQIRQDVRFIARKETDTSRDLDARQKELKLFLEKK